MRRIFGRKPFPLGRRSGKRPLCRMYFLGGAAARALLFTISPPPENSGRGEIRFRGVALSLSKGTHLALRAGVLARSFQRCSPRSSRGSSCPLFPERPTALLRGLARSFQRDRPTSLLRRSSCPLFPERPTALLRGLARSFQRDRPTSLLRRSSCPFFPEGPTSLFAGEFLSAFFKETHRTLRGRSSCPLFPE